MPYDNYSFRAKNFGQCYVILNISGVARSGPTSACALPSTFQALPSPARQESHDSIKN